MKKFIAIALVFLYAAAMLQTYVPLISYAVNKEYIANVLCENKSKPQMHCNGKCHLNKELTKAGNEESKSNSGTRNEVMDFLAIQINSGEELNYTASTTSDLTYSYNDNYSFNFPGTIFHPPTL